MDEWQLLILLVLAIPVVAIVALVLAIKSRDRLRVLEWRISRPRSQDRCAWRRARWRRLDCARRSRPRVEPETVEHEQRPRQRPRPRNAAVEVPLPPLAPAKPKIGWEERFGTQWSVWLGGIALALGGFFLVRYSIEQGWFGPAARVALGAILAIALDRRRRMDAASRNQDGPHRSSRRAYPEHPDRGRHDHRLRHGLCGLRALRLHRCRRSPSCCSASSRSPRLRQPCFMVRPLAGLGLVGAYLTPLIVSTETPNYWALYLYLAVVTAAAFGACPCAPVALACDLGRRRFQPRMDAARHRQCRGRAC